MYAQDQAAKLRKLVERAHEERAVPRVIAVTSGKGGTGKSTLSVNLAIALRRLGRRVLLIDADFGLANIDLMLGVSSTKGLGQVLSGETTALEAVQDGLEGVRFLSGGSGVEALLNLDESSVGMVLAQLLQLEKEADMILLDTGAGVTPVILQLISAVSETLIVTTPEPTSVMDAYALIKTLSHRKPIPALRLIVNRVETRREAVETPEAIISLARKNMHLAIDLLGTISGDPLVSQTIKRQVPILIAYPGAQVSKDIVTIAKKLLGMPVANQTAEFSSFFKKLLRARLLNH